MSVTIMWFLTADTRHRSNEIDEIVEKSLRDAAIWDEMKDRLKKAPWAFRRAAATTLHCQSAGRRTGSSVDG